MSRIFTDSVTTAHAFGFIDDKGRTIGARVTTYTAMRNGVIEGYCFKPQATRNDEAFGAIQDIRTFAIPGARDEAVAAYLKAALVRAAANGKPAAEAEPARGA
jgi:hypothetical protein